MKKCVLSLSLLAMCWLGFTSCENKANAANDTAQDAAVEEGLVAESCAEESVEDDEVEIIEAKGEVQELTAAQYNKMVAHYKENPYKFVGYRPCVVDFYATWCGPCKRLAPIMEKLAAKYKNKVSFYKVDVDKAEELSATYDIQSIPTVFFCANGEIRSQIGFVPESDLEEVISAMLTAPLK